MRAEGASSLYFWLVKAHARLRGALLCLSRMCLEVAANKRIRFKLLFRSLFLVFVVIFKIILMSVFADTILYILVVFIYFFTSVSNLLFERVILARKSIIIFDHSGRLKFQLF